MEPGLVGMTETHLRDAAQMEGREYVMVGKGRRKRETFGGGVVEEWKSFMEEKVWKVTC